MISNWYWVISESIFSKDSSYVLLRSRVYEIWNLTIPNTFWIGVCCQDPLVLRIGVRSHALIILWLQRRRLLLGDRDLLLHTLGQFGNLPVFDMGELDLVVEPCGVLTVIGHLDIARASLETTMAKLFRVKREACIRVLVTDWLELILDEGWGVDQALTMLIVTNEIVTWGYVLMVGFEPLLLQVLICSTMLLETRVYWSLMLADARHQPWLVNHVNLTVALWV